MRPEVKVSEEFNIALAAIESKLNEPRIREKPLISTLNKQDCIRLLSGEIDELGNATDSEEVVSELIDVAASALIALQIFLKNK
jgi:hypothetical protein